MHGTHEYAVFCVQPGGCLRGHLRVPGDKSISHRAIILGSIAEGRTRVTGFLEAGDTLATLNALRDMGVVFDGPDQGVVTIHGVGMHGLRAPGKILRLGNSGTSMRLLAGLLAGQRFDVQMTGDASLSRRPMKRVAEPLSAMGAAIQTGSGGTPPLKMVGGRKLQGIRYHMPVASAQVKSSLLLAGMYARGRTCIIEPAPSRDHTERMLAGFGYPVEQEGDTVCIEGGGSLVATAIDVPADISSAAFFMVGASIAPGSDLTLKHVGVNPTRAGVISILRDMGADIELHNEHQVGGEPVADIRVRAGRLHGIEIAPSLVSLAIDEFPAIFIAGACAEGKTVLTGAAELRVKESDRIGVMAEGLSSIGIKVEPTPDGMIVHGGDITGGRVESYGDHRIAMAMSIAALRASDTIVVDDCANINTSFPGFVAMAHGVGLRIQAP